jgi:hypothetical protein
MYNAFLYLLSMLQILPFSTWVTQFP